MAKNDRRKIEAAMLLVFIAFLLIYSSSSAEEQALARQGLFTTTDVKFTPDLTVYYPSGSEFLMALDGHPCFVRDSIMYGCEKEGTLYTKELIDGDWGSFGSCKGWMAYFSCDPTECNYLEDGVCSGSKDDADVECISDDQCEEGYCGPKNICITGADAECDIEDGEFKCTEGLIYHCVNSQWYLFSSCYEIEKTKECKVSLSDDWHMCVKKVTTKTTDTGEEEKITGCQEDADCKIFGWFGNKVCENHECVIGESSEIEIPSLKEWYNDNKEIAIIFGVILIALFILWVFTEKRPQ